MSARDPSHTHNAARASDEASLVGGAVFPTLGRFAPRRWHERRPLPLVVGQTYEAWHPFLRDTYQPPPFDDGAGWSESGADHNWRPGWSYEPSGPEETWDGEGVQLRIIVSTHKPGRYPERVFYVRQWRDPDGKVFGKTALRCVVAPTFRHWLHGERWPTYSRARAAHAIWAADQSACGASDAAQVESAGSRDDKNPENTSQSGKEG